jgi:hypothetical protein
VVALERLRNARASRSNHSPALLEPWIKRSKRKRATIRAEMRSPSMSNPAKSARSSVLKAAIAASGSALSTTSA